MRSRWSRRFGCDRHTPAQARRFCREQLAGAADADGPSPDRIDDAVLIIDELVTNAVDAGSASTVVRIALDRDEVLVAVDDDAPGEVEPQYPSRTDLRGRGLRIVDAIARDWGTRATANGKQVWAVLAAPSY